MALEWKGLFGVHLPQDGGLGNLLVAAPDTVSTTVRAFRPLAVAFGPSGPTSVTRYSGPPPDLASISGREPVVSSGPLAVRTTAIAAELAAGLLSFRWDGCHLAGDNALASGRQPGAGWRARTLRPSFPLADQQNISDTADPSESDAGGNGAEVVWFVFRGARLDRRGVAKLRRQPPRNPAREGAPA